MVTMREELTMLEVARSERARPLAVAAKIWQRAQQEQ
jgi:hypothetical protein